MNSSARMDGPMKCSSPDTGSLARMRETERLTKSEKVVSTPSLLRTWSARSVSMVAIEITNIIAFSLEGFWMYTFFMDIPSFINLKACSTRYCPRYVSSTVSAVAPKRMFSASPFALGRLVTRTLTLRSFESSLALSSSNSSETSTRYSVLTVGFSSFLGLPLCP